jgi:hypothetical protein
VISNYETVYENGVQPPGIGENSMFLSPKPSADKRNKSTEYAQKLIKEFFSPDLHKSEQKADEMHFAPANANVSSSLVFLFLYVVYFPE